MDGSADLCIVDNNLIIGGKLPQRRDLISKGRRETLAGHMRELALPVDRSATGTPDSFTKIVVFDGKRPIPSAYRAEGDPPASAPDHERFDPRGGRRY